MSHNAKNNALDALNVCFYLQKDFKNSATSPVLVPCSSVGEDSRRNGAGDENRTRVSSLGSCRNNHYTTPALVIHYNLKFKQRDNSSRKTNMHHEKYIVVYISGAPVFAFCRSMSVY